MKDMFNNRISRVSLLLLSLLLSGPALATDGPMAATVSVANAHQEAAQTYLGRVESLRSADIVSRVEGIIARRHFHDGDRVEAGQLLFEIDPAQQQAAVARAKAAVASARAGANHARLHFERLGRLTVSRAVSQADKDTAKANWDIAQATLAQAQAELTTQQISLGYTRISAPFSGRISHSPYHQGTLVGPATGTLATVTQLDPLRVVIAVNEPDYLRNLSKNDADGAPRLDRLSLRLRLSDGSPYPYSGIFDALDNHIDPLTGTVALRLQVPNPQEKLLPGGVVNVTLHTPAAASR
ncbi:MULTISPECIES: efflux RND transporter periplasmic adaptor subunit [unclassified Brenneria]|uniref:efflux RND transporter periplasmic adaptor subunit n=1 Tax=unclassified Brenneria TaxID=2634434 RepID=UPI0018F103F5|nr:efflux RND transporter periplasmic adaptor subunit [Brenneria sp. L3-3C-1]MBJ7221528.1 efflux RND transporter periplasmic adaptor subunit [Brenneria sp. L3-3C-1]MEE3642770.1 efflux RND transporter periplasmic adaptor subunit [Brenneria sp. L3_3C_1]